MKTIMLILAAIATMSFAMCLDAQGQRLSLPEGQADSRIPLPAQFRVSVEEGIITLRDMNSGKVVGRTTFERLGVVTPTQDKLRHVALDVTAAVVAGNGSRERIVNPRHKVYTVADHKKGKAAYATSLSMMLHLFSRVTHRRTVVMRHSLRTGRERFHRQRPRKPAKFVATVKEQPSQIQKVSAQLEVSKPAPQVVHNP